MVSGAWSGLPVSSNGGASQALPGVTSAASHVLNAGRLIGWACRYRNSTSNDLSYWGLDYPPLSGYQARRL